MTRYQVVSGPQPRSYNDHEEVSFSIDRETEFPWDVTITKITRFYPVSARGVERSRGVKRTETETMTIPRDKFSGLIKAIVESLLSEIRDLEDTGC